MSIKSRAHSLGACLRLAAIVAVLLVGTAFAKAQAGSYLGSFTYPSAGNGSVYCPPFDMSVLPGSYSLATTDYSVTTSTGTYNPPQSLYIAVDGTAYFYGNMLLSPAAASGPFDEYITVTFYLNGSSSYPLTVSFEVYGEVL